MSSNLSGTMAASRVFHDEAEMRAEIDRLEKRVIDLETVCLGLKEENDELNKVQDWLQEEAALLVKESQQLALVDTLTGIPNRRALHSLLYRRIHAPDRQEDGFAYVVLDIDDLKTINDSSGHAAGDNALRRCAALLQDLAGANDIIARYGGDEFVIVLDNVTRATASGEAQRICETLERGGLKASLGISFYPEDGTDEALLFTAADRALYMSKNTGKNCYNLTGPK